LREVTDADPSTSYQSAEDLAISSTFTGVFSVP
jgi:hypothetical protein